MQRFLGILLIMLTGTNVFGQTITVDSKVVTQNGRMAAITIQSDGDDTTWTVVPPNNVDIFREYDPGQSAIKLRFLSYSDGSYFVVVSTTKDKKVAQKVCTVIVGNEPNPGPGPTNPDAQLIKNLKAVYAADVDTEKDTHLDALIALYDQGAVFTKTRTDLKTYGQLWKTFSDVSVTLGCNGKLKGIQQLISNEIATAGIPVSAADGGTAIDREKLVPLFHRIVTLLKQIK